MNEIVIQPDSELSALAERVRASGQRITLTSHGRPVADLVPHTQAHRTKSKTEALASLRELRRHLPRLSAEEIRASIDEGGR